VKMECFVCDLIKFYASNESKNKERILAEVIIKGVVIGISDPPPEAFCNQHASDVLVIGHEFVNIIARETKIDDTLTEILSKVQVHK
jgi:hypothetical protein